MAPAFSSVREAGAFALLLFLTLLSPILIGKSALPPREKIYASLSWNTGAYPFIHHEIFEEKGDIDIAFLGSSHMYDDIDTPYVQKQLSEKLGRPATVLSLCWRGPGFDNLYFIAKDLLAHRKVHLLVFYDDDGTDHPNRHAWQLVRVADDWSDLAGLPLRNRIPYYYGAILGMPRNLYSLLGLDSPPDLTSRMLQYLDWDGDAGHYATLPSNDLGAGSSLANNNESSFVPFSPHGNAKPADVSLYSDATQDQFEFSGTPAPLQAYFAGKFATLAQANGAELVCLHLPVFDQRKASKILQGRLWPEILRSHSKFIGISPKKLFSGLDDESICRMFHDPGHLNANGQRYFTALITPRLLDLYESADR